MSWQEELRKLDEDLAAGRISADNYRVRRDQVLSSAVTQGEPAGQQQSSGRSTELNQQQSQSADSTQVVRPVDPSQGGADSPQPGSLAQQNAGQTPQSWQQQQARGQPAQEIPQSPAGGFPQPQQRPGGFAQPLQQQPQAAWNAPEADASPPWGGSDLPPMQAAGPDTWAGQGPESFDNQKSNGSKAKLAAVAVAVVLLGGVAFGAYWLWGRGEATAGATTTTTAQPPTARTSPSQPPDELPVAELPGGTERHPEVKRFADVPSLNYLNDDELQVYKELKPGKTKFRVQHFDNGNLAVFLLVKSPSLENSDEIEQKLAEIQESNGAKLRKDAPAGVAVTEYTATDDNLAQIRAHYFSENVLVRVEVISKDGLKSANTQFDSIIKKQLQELPADG